MANVGGRGVCADALVVGAGPGGSATAANLARQGLHVVLLEKATFPRDKVCGDGLTPRAVRQLIRLGIDVSEEAGWKHTQGLRIHGGTVPPFVLPWPELADYPNFGMVCRRAKLDEMLARHAESLGVELITRANVKTPIMDERTGRIVGVRTTDGREFHAPVVVAADGNSSRLALAMGRERRPDRPMGVAVRAYFTSPLSQGDHLESWLELWDGKPHESDLLPGYGWAFPVGDGTVNVGLGMLNSSDAFQKTDYRSLMTRWLSHLPAQWGLTPDNQEGPIRGAALPMAFNRKPHYADGLMLLGDAGGMVSPFNGEGIAQALMSGRLAAQAAAQASARTTTSGREQVLAQYPKALSSEMGGYYTLGRVFVALIEHPEVMRLCTRYGLPRKRLMKLVTKLLSDGWERRGGDGIDHFIQLLTRMVPEA